MVLPETAFCEGCPLANGVCEVAESFKTYGFAAVAPNDGFQLSFTDAANSQLETYKIQTARRPDFDSSWAVGTAGAILERVRNCHTPRQTIVKRLGGLLGAKTVTHCGAFPNQNPRKIKFGPVSTGWFHPEDFC